MAQKGDENLAELLQSGFRYALSLTRDRARAEDILQDAWLAVLKANGPHTRPYLFSAVRSRFLNLYKRELLLSVVPLDDLAESEQPVSTLDISHYLDHALLEKALNGLRSVEREALFLMTIEGYTAEEIAAFTQQPRSTVLSHVHRAKQKVRRFFATKSSEAAR